MKPNYPIWLPIKNYEGVYEVSSFGQIRRQPNWIYYSDGRKRFYKGGMLNQHLTQFGYVSIGMSYSGYSNTCQVHRVVAKTFIPNEHNKPNINHKDGNKLNNHVSNLEWCTQAENMRHLFDVLGYRASDETKKKLSQSLTGRKMSSSFIENNKRRQSGGLAYQSIKVIDTNTNKEYGCLKDYARENNINYSTLKSNRQRGRISHLIEINKT